MTAGPSSQPKPERMAVTSIQFAAEQDGVPERQLKAKLIAAFDRMPEVSKAFLALVMYGKKPDAPLAVALCVKLREGHDVKQDVVQAASKQFALLFNQAQQMDIVFLSDQQELELGHVCRPFYAAIEV
jgi:hypothetical protein